jgi:hypothetical protein
MTVVSIVIVITGLDPVIHLLRKSCYEDGWMPGTSTGMTSVFVDQAHGALHTVS